MEKIQFQDPNDTRPEEERAIQCVQVTEEVKETITIRDIRAEIDQLQAEKQASAAHYNNLIQGKQDRIAEIKRVLKLK